MQNVLAKHEMFEEIGGGETSKQGQEVESVSCQANNVGQFRQALMRSITVSAIDSNSIILIRDSSVSLFISLISAFNLPHQYLADNKLQHSFIILTNFE